MKKPLLLTSALALCAILATSCGQTTKRYEPGQKIKFGMICLHGEESTYDKNFINGYTAAINKAKEKGLVTDDSLTSIKTGVAEDQNCYDAAKQLVNDGCNFIFADSFGHGQYIKQAAIDFPNVQFAHATGTDALTSGLNNLHNAFASIYEGRFLAGVAGGFRLHEITNEDGTPKYPDEEGKTYTVGYVGAFPYAEVISGYTSWYLGVKRTYQHANIEMKVTYTNSWYDETKEGAAAEALINKGCVLISQHADSMGAPNACKAKGVPNVSYNMATPDMDQQCKDTYVAHSRIDWEPYFTNLIESTFKGRTIEGEYGRNWTGTLATGSVKYDVSTTLLNETHRAEIKVVESLLKTGYPVFDVGSFTVTKPQDGKTKGTDYDVDANGHLTKYIADTTGDYAPDTDIIGDDPITGAKCVLESVYRSAPSFDLIIDGISVAE